MKRISQVTPHSQTDADLALASGATVEIFKPTWTPGALMARWKRRNDRREFNTLNSHGDPLYQRSDALPEFPTLSVAAARAGRDLGLIDNSARDKATQTHPSDFLGRSRSV
jgi:hypothetical protein